MSLGNSPSDLLLRERRNYKKILYNLYSARNHLSFLKLCCKYDLIPKGLQLKVNCVALASHETSLLQDFSNTILNTERELINNLIGHYEKIITTYGEKLQCNQTEINEIKVQANPTTLFYHNKVFLATKRNVENLTKRKQYITNNKLDRLFFDKYKRRRPRDNSIPIQAPTSLENTQQHNTIIARNTQQIQSISTATTTLNPLINNNPTGLINNSITTVANVNPTLNSSEGSPSHSLSSLASPTTLASTSSSLASPTICSPNIVASVASILASSTSTVTNPRVVTSRLNPIVTTIPNLSNLPGTTINLPITTPNLSNLPGTTSNLPITTPNLSNLLVTTSNLPITTPNLSNLPGTAANLPITTTYLPITTANPNLTNLPSRNIYSTCTTITTTTANTPITSPRIDPSRRICNILTPVTTNTITLNNSATTIPVCLSPIIREATPTTPDHTYSIVTRSRARQQQQDFHQ